ncbi:hypothetical protein HY989_02100 [Candidatus Micrarchaeota archaeon]|nr:hypothetical protein [Candidatus Micrarchaeota archaeon]
MSGDSREQRQKNEEAFRKVFSKIPEMLDHLRLEKPVQHDLIVGYLGLGGRHETYTQLTNRFNLTNSDLSRIIHLLGDWAGIRDKKMAKSIERHGPAPYSHPIEYPTYYAVRDAYLKKPLWNKLSKEEQDKLKSHFRISDEKKPVDLPSNTNDHRLNKVHIREILDKLGIAHPYGSIGKASKKK